MKVPTLTAPRTSTPDTTRQYSRLQVDPEAYGAGVGRALQGFGQALSGFEAKVRAREQQTQRFGALTDFTAFETSMNENMLEWQRNAQPDAKGFAIQAEAQYDKLSQEFLAKNIPPELQDEFKYRVTQLKQGVVGNALKFQYDAGDKYFRQGISDIYEGARKALDPRLGGDASQLEAYKTKVQEAIATSDLPEVEKNELWRKAQQGLEGVAYRTAVAKEAISTGGNSTTFNLLRKSEGFRTTPYWDVDAYRIGYGSDTITRADGSVVKVEKGMKITRADAERDLARRIPEFQRTVIGQVGREAWGRLPENVRAGLTSVSYNYGSLPANVVKAVKTGDIETIAQSVAGLSANKSRRQHEAEVIRGNAKVGSSANDDPAFANVPYEDKIALQSDALRETQAGITANSKALAAEYDSNLNGLLTSIHDGAAGQVEIDAFREANPNMDYGDLTKLDGALKKYSEDTGLASTGVARVASGDTFDPTNTEDKKQVAAIVGNAGLEALKNGDQQYVSQELLPLVAKTGIIPASVTGALTGLIRSGDTRKINFAMDALAQMSDANPRAYAGLPEKLQKDVEFWQSRKDLMQPEDLGKMINPTGSIERRQAEKQLRDEAADILTHRNNGVPALKDFVKDFVSGYDGWFSSAPTLGALPWAAQALYKEYQTEFVEAFTKYGNEAEATEAAKTALSKRWATTSIGQKVLMRNPPEKFYKTYNGSFEWISEQVRAENKIEGDFQLISDATTNQEAGAFREGKLDRPPSYKVVAYKDGIWSEVPGRQWFKVPEMVKEKDFDAMTQRNELNKTRHRLNELGDIINASKVGGVQIDPDDQAEYDELLVNYHKLKKGLINDRRRKTRGASDEASGGGF